MESVLNSTRALEALVDTETVPNQTNFTATVEKAGMEAKLRIKKYQAKMAKVGPLF